MTLLGAAEQARAEGLEAGGARLHFLRGADRDAWKTNLQRYARVRYNAVYPGVDIEYYGDANGLEYDFIVAAARRSPADPPAFRRV